MATARSLDGKTYQTLVQVIGDLCAAKDDAARRVVLRNALKSRCIVGELQSGGFIPRPTPATVGSISVHVQDARSPYDVAREITENLRSHGR